MDINVVFFQNDLRIHDHAPLRQAMSYNIPLVGVYVFDPYFYQETRYGFKKTSKYRAKFILESVKVLKTQLLKYNIPLIIKYGASEKVMRELGLNYNIKNFFYNSEFGSEELKILKLIKLNLKTTTFVSFETKSLISTKNLPFTISNLPDVFTDFRKAVEANFKVESIISLPNYYQDLINVDDDQVSLEKLGFKDDFDLVIPAGELAGLERLSYYLFKSKKALYYKNTRNGMFNYDDSTKFSPYLALGALSPRQIYFEVKRFEKQYGSNVSTYWIVFELLWRDYFHFVHLKYGNKLFMPGGIYGGKTNYIANQSYREAWIRGETGYQLVDANMKEINTTGWMSNRGRQNVASFLVKYLNQDWRFGAAYFESMLLDYDVSSNYGNWLYVASLGNDKRENRVFNVNKQGRDYDADGKYLRKWLPAFKKLPAEFYYTLFELNELQEVTLDFKLGLDYPKPIIKSLFKD
jgi:deoxyribodipyrimidine photo-lyase